MATILKGADVTAKLNADLQQRAEALKAKNIVPTLAIVRVGEREDDVAYERAAIKRCETIGLNSKTFTLDASATQDELLAIINEVNKDSSIYGALLFRPLPKQFNDNLIRNALFPAKDVDCVTDGSLAGVFANVDVGFPPCTPRACMEILEHFKIDLAGKNVVVVGRSLVVGKPVALMLLNKNSTVTIAHSKTADLPATCRAADILIVAVGQAKMITEKYLSPGQVVIDVGINFNSEGKIIGDVNFADAERIVGAVSPVPGGVGTITTSILAKHVIEAAERI
jgi:methylenetetrahydrofolate dehydrogenase (NADP+)/methenyltetrahydrofolate cyclohydrolase